MQGCTFQPSPSWSRPVIVVVSSFHVYPICMVTISPIGCKAWPGEAASVCRRAAWIRARRRAVGKHLDNHPEVWKRPAGLLVLEILRHTYPPTGDKYEFGLSGKILDQYWQASQKLRTGGGKKTDSVQGKDFFHAVLYSGYVAAVNTTSIPLVERGFARHLTSTQVETVVGNYLDHHAEHWDQPAAKIVVRALLEAFPKTHG